MKVLKKKKEIFDSPCLVVGNNSFDLINQILIVSSGSGCSESDFTQDMIGKVVLLEDIFFCSLQKKGINCKNTGCLAIISKKYFCSVF